MPEWPAEGKRAEKEEKDGEMTKIIFGPILTFFRQIYRISNLFLIEIFRKRIFLSFSFTYINKKKVKKL